MFRAMDRASTSFVRWSRLSFVLALTSVDFGCSQLESLRRSDPPAELGIQRTSRDIYDQAHQGRSPTPEALPLPEGLPAGSPMLAEGSEVGMAIRPAPAAAPAPASGVNLQPPMTIGTAIDPSTTSASTGVPNSALLLASTTPPVAPDPPKPTPDRLVQEARSVLNKLTSYQVLMHRQERVNGTLQPEEDVVLAVRREPLAIRLSWPTGPHKGREVLYRADEPGGLMHVNMADSALPIPRLSIAPDSPMVLKNSRHPVTEAGFESVIQGLEDPSKLAPGSSPLTYKGLETPPPLDHPHHALIRTSPTGEVARVYLDPKTHLPALFAVDGPNGELIERYVFRDILPNPPELATAEAFDPDARWGPARGLFGRVARGSDKSEPAPPR